MRRRNPIDGQKLVLRSVLLFGGGVYLPGKLGLLPPFMQDVFQKYFAGNAPRPHSFWDDLNKVLQLPGGGTPPKPGGSTPGSGTPASGKSPTPQPPQPGNPTNTTAPVTITLGADVYSYAPGTTITLLGTVTQDGHGLPSRQVVIVDPDVAGSDPGGGTPWLSATTDAQGNYQLSYQSNETGQWRSHALDVGSGAQTGDLTFSPQAEGRGGDPIAWSGWPDLYQQMSDEWAAYSGAANLYDPDVVISFHDTWQEVVNRLGTPYNQGVVDAAGAAMQAIWLAATTYAETIAG